MLNDQVIVRGSDHRRAATWLMVAVAGLLHLPANAEDDGVCGSPYVTKFGPYDSRTEQGQPKHIVESYHFTPAIEGLVRGEGASLGAEIAYTLQAFPNHHRALVAMMNLGIRVKAQQPPGASFTVECYFNRALRYRGDDTIVRILYARFLSLNSRKGEALRQLQVATESAGDNGFTHYNIGLTYLEMSEYPSALAEAHRASELGFMRPELKNRLVAAGKWAEPVAAAASSAPASQAN